MKDKISKIYVFPLCAIAGALSVLSFAPFGLSWLQFITIGFLFYVAAKPEISVKRTFFYGLLFGFTWTIGGVHWLFVSMNHYGGLPAWLAVIALAALALCLGIYCALGLTLGKWVQKRLNASAMKTLLLIFPACWILSEWMRGWNFTGFPWLITGYAHDIGILSHFAPILGVYGIGWLVALMSGSLALMLHTKMHYGKFHILPILIIFVITISGVILAHIKWTQPHGNPIQVRLIQGNVAQEMKFSKESIRKSLLFYSETIREKPADLIAIPETAIPVLSSHLPKEYIAELQEFSQHTNSNILLGIPYYDEKDYTNSVIGISPNSQLYGYYRYDKHHLVPFGEFIPWGAHWFVRMMQIPLGDFMRGDIYQKSFAIKDQQILPNICYEDLFGEEIAHKIKTAIENKDPEPTILLNFSNIAWFGNTIALPQHLQISRIRAMETGRPMLRTTNTGVTAIIASDGQVLSQLPYYTQAEIHGEVQGFTGTTPYIYFGNSLFLAIALISLLIALIFGRNKQRYPSEPIEIKIKSR